ncbi:MAG: alpha/beta fold hydrolase [Candidatus Obscuribacterales bacterium]|nr:alpha/beta fold hydrolase [Candidatus Obscuribacterales bacterium]
MKKRRNRALMLASASTFGLFVHNFSAYASDSGKSQDANAGLKFVRDVNPQQTSTSSAPILSKQKPGQRGNAPCLRWIDSTMPPQAVILCIHGLGLHNGSYEDFGKRMSRLGYAVYAVDMRGFGSYKEADGKKQVDFDGCLSDIKSTLKVLHRAHPNLPLFLLGESMGGAIALRATALYPDLVDGLISSVPSGERFKQGRGSLSVAMHLLEGPNKSFDVGTGVINQATVKPELKEAWANDPLNRMNLSPIELITFQKFMNQNHDIAPLIKDKPVLFVQGCNDKLVKPEGTVELFNELGTKDRKIQMIENGEHLIFEENQFSDAAIESLDNWIATRLAKIEEGKASVSASLVPKDAQPTGQGPKLEPKTETKPETEVNENKANKVGTPQ